MLFIIGLGLGDASDITVKGLEIVKRCDFIYLESYTSILTCGQDELVSEINSLIPSLNCGLQEKFYGKKIILADRDFVEQGVDEMLLQAETNEVSFLVVG